MNGYVSSKSHVSLNDECNLISIAPLVDDLGIQIDDATTEAPVYCGRLSVKGKEYHDARQQGLKPEIILAVYVEEYNGQDYVDFGGKRYAIYRRYERTDGLVELYCNQLIGDGTK